MVSGGKRAVAGSRGKKSCVKTVIEDAPSLNPSLSNTSSLAVSTDAVNSLAVSTDAVSWSSSLDVGATVECSTSSDGPREVTQPTIKLGKC